MRAACATPSGAPPAHLQPWSLPNFIKSATITWRAQFSARQSQTKVYLNPWSLPPTSSASATTDCRLKCERSAGGTLQATVGSAQADQCNA